MKQLLAAVLIGVAIAGVGLAPEAVFAKKPVNQAVHRNDPAGAVSACAPARSDHHQ
jgi:hypothetical protein